MSLLYNNHSKQIMYIIKTFKQGSVFIHLCNFYIDGAFITFKLFPISSPKTFWKLKFMFIGPFSVFHRHPAQSLLKTCYGYVFNARLNKLLQLFIIPEKSTEKRHKCHFQTFKTIFRWCQVIGSHDQRKIKHRANITALKRHETMRYMHCIFQTVI